MNSQAKLDPNRSAIVEDDQTQDCCSFEPTDERRASLLLGMRAFGVVRAGCEWSGGNDSGSTTGYYAVLADGTLVERASDDVDHEVVVAESGQPYRVRPIHSYEEQWPPVFFALLSGIVDDEHPSWDSIPGADGSMEVVLDDARPEGVMTIADCNYDEDDEDYEEEEDEEDEDDGTSDVPPTG